MPMTEYETAYLQHMASDLAFRKEQEAAMQARHAANLKATDAATAAQNARAVAEAAIAAAGAEAAAAQRYAAEKLSAPTFDNLLTAAVARIDDRTATGKANIPLAVSEVLDTHAELANRLAAGSALPAAKGRQP
jgi:hypothetical protein